MTTEIWRGPDQMNKFIIWSINVHATFDVGSIGGGSKHIMYKRWAYDHDVIWMESHLPMEYLDSCMKKSFQSCGSFVYGLGLSSRMSFPRGVRPNSWRGILGSLLAHRQHFRRRSDVDFYIPFSSIRILLPLAPWTSRPAYYSSFNSWSSPAWPSTVSMLTWVGFDR